MSTAQVHRIVRLTARSSALLFAAAQAASILRPAQRASRPLYAAFLAAHAAHFTAVTWYAVLTGGRRLFPGGRSLADVGGWPTMVGIVVAFSGLAVTGWLAKAPTLTAHHTWLPTAGRAATGLIAAMFASVYLQQVPRQGARRVRLQPAAARV
ncbi:MAG TPA: hypothetical protein VE476_03925 [Propionibacteriaceae bacterium]|jgi:hypothetical protein|nr:hypothetical protein [Propionibacteriaceae bacterium]